MRRYRDMVLGCVILAGGSAVAAAELSDNTSLDLRGPGLGMVLDGVGLAGAGPAGGRSLSDAAGVISVDVPGTIRQAYLYWGGFDTQIVHNGPEDFGEDQLLVDGVPVDGVLIGVEPALNGDAYAYRADITASLQTQYPGPSTVQLTVADPSPSTTDDRIDGASLFVVYEDPTDLRGYRLLAFDGADYVANPLATMGGVSDPTRFANSAALEPRPATLAIVAGGATPKFDDLMSVGGITISNALDASDGANWDSDVHGVIIDAMSDETLVAPIVDAASLDHFNWILAALRVECGGSIGDRMWLDTDGDGAQDEGEPGLPDVELELDREIEPGVYELHAATSSDENGLFGFDGLCAGTYRLRITSAGLPEGSLPAPVNASGDENDSDFVNGIISVTLPNDTTIDGDNDGGFTIPPATGGCCLPSGACIEVTAEFCQEQGGSYQGDFSLCFAVICPQPPGACCLSDGTCIELASGACGASGGSHQGPGSTCGSVTCAPPMGACCLNDGSCLAFSEAGCASQSGTYEGDFTNCASVNCAPPLGACCREDGTCDAAPASACVGLAEFFHGPGTFCGDVQCAQPAGGCCLASGACVEGTENECGTLGGSYQGNNSGCAQASCPQPPGACCRGNGACVIVPDAVCTFIGGEFQGSNVSCGDVACPLPAAACCMPDGTCVELNSSACAMQTGVYQGPSTSCAIFNCPQPVGGCCLADGSCIELTEGNCIAQSGVFQGGLTSCASSVCPQPNGGCCLADGTCVEVTEEACTAQAGSFQGDLTSCAATTCPQPDGACCLIDGSCVEVDEEVCTAQSGTFNGDFSACATTTCVQPDGACCLVDGSCVEVTEEACVLQAGSFAGDLTACASTACPQPPGACCLIDGSCVEVTEEDCVTQAGLFGGDLTECGTTTCPQPNGACCLIDGSCVEVTEEDCVTQAGAFEGDLTACASTACPQPDGACCLNDGSCIEVTEEDCVAQAGVFGGDLTACASTTCPQPPGACCLIDGTCIEVTEETCVAQAALFQGDLTTCVVTNCPQPTGACCLADGSCGEVTEEDCVLQTGVFGGDLTTCAATVCPQPAGACCLADGSCVEVTEEDCIAQSGAFEGDLTTCAATACPQPQQACCLSSGACIITDAAACVAQGGVDQGSNTTCATVTCPQPDVDCCLPDGSCSNVPSDECTALGGSDQGFNSGCSFANCPPPFGACCLEDGTCIESQEAACGGLAGQFLGALSACVTANCQQPSETDPERDHPGWNWLDNAMNLTGDQPTFWAVSSGQPAAGGLSPFTSLDPGSPPGRPDPEGSGDRVLRGYVMAWAVNAFDEEIKWNHLSGSATVVDYRGGSAWEYGSANYAVVADVPNGMPTGMDQGTLRMDGMEYAQSFSQLLMKFQGHGASGLSGPRLVTSSTELTLLPVGMDVRQETDGPLTTKASFNVWNQNEVKFSGAHRCITCWDQAMLDTFGTPNHFLIQTLQTDHGKARIEGLESQLCDVDVDPNDGPLGFHPDDVVSREAPLLGVVARHLSFEGGMDMAKTGTNLVGMGVDPSATIQYDMVGPPPESAGGPTTLPPSPLRVSTTKKGSLLIFPKVELRWDANGFLIQDTFLSMTNDYPEDVRVLMYFVNGDPPITGTSAAAASPESAIVIDERLQQLLESAHGHDRRDEIVDALDALIDVLEHGAPDERERGR